METVDQSMTVVGKDDTAAARAFAPGTDRPVLVAESIDRFVARIRHDGPVSYPTSARRMYASVRLAIERTPWRTYLRAQPQNRLVPPGEKIPVPVQTAFRSAANYFLCAGSIVVDSLSGARRPVIVSSASARQGVEWTTAPGAR